MDEFNTPLRIPVCQTHICAIFYQDVLTCHTCLSSPATVEASSLITLLAYEVMPAALM